jgi:hypothetical protein
VPQVTERKLETRVAYLSPDGFRTQYEADALSFFRFVIKTIRIGKGKITFCLKTLVYFALWQMSNSSRGLLHDLMFF